MANKVLPRNKMNKKYTWNAESVFSSNKAWEKEIKQIIADIPTIKKFQGRLK
jgi:oligoendopeptidase F